MIEAADPAAGDSYTLRTKLLDFSLRLDTVVLRDPVGSPGEVRGRIAADVLAARAGGWEVFHVKVFADVTTAPLGRFGPAALTHVVAPPCIGGLLAGYQLWSVAAGGESPPTLSELTLDGLPVGCLVETAHTRMAFLSQIDGMVAGPDAEAQCGAMFDRASRALQAAGFSFRDVARTWIYAARLLDWYDGLNRARNAFFDKVGVRRPGAAFDPPASTGIQGAHPAGAECFFDLVAVARVAADPGERAFEPMRTDRQNEAYDYGSAFSRGMALPSRGPGLLLVSGTASIDTEGASKHHGDHAAQLLDTYENTEAVLRDAGAGFEDSVTGALFFKDEATWEAWLALRRDGQLPALPAVPVFADVCRNELLFEMEITAITPHCDTSANDSDAQERTA